MKNISLAVICFLCAFVTISAQTKKLNVEKSTVAWQAYKVVGGHKGAVKIKEGGLTFQGKKLIGGSASVDLNTITCTDLEGDMKAKIEGHLKNEDFFDVAKFPKVSVVFKNVKLKSKTVDTYVVKANITIKGITKPIVFDLKVGANEANTILKIDRSQFGLVYGSALNLGDKMIKNEFDLTVSLAY